MKTIKNVQLMKTGEYWLSTGPTTFTKRHLASAVAAVADPFIKEPRLAVGHADGRLDGEPAFGKFTNLNLQDEGNSLYGDLTGVPDWLVDGDVLAAAFPNRSIEGYFGHQGAVGSPIHDFALTRVVLLGVEMPGISTLEDLEVQLTGEPEYTMLDEAEMLDNISVFAVAAIMDGEPMGKKAVNASISVDDVRREFYTQVSTGDRSNWWANEIQVDPQQVIVADESNGDVYRVPYAANASGKVEFSDPVKVEVVYQDQLAASGHKPVPVGTGTVYASKAESRPKEGDMKDAQKKAVRAALGLAEDATDEQVKKAMFPEADGDEDDDDDTEETEDGDEEDEEDDETAEVEVPVAAKKTVKVKAGTKKKLRVAASAAAPGTVIVDAEQFAELQNTVKVLAAGRAAGEATEQENEVKAAIQAGKIPPARKDHWVAAMKADPEGTREVLASLAAVLPINPKGTSEHDSEEIIDNNTPDPIFAAAMGGRKAPDPARSTFLEVGTVMRER